MHTLLLIFGIQLKVQCRYSRDGFMQFNYSLSCKMHWNWGKFICFLQCKILYLVLAIFITIMWVNHLCLISEFRDVEEYIKKNLVTNKFTVVIHGEGHWWCKALFIRTIMWVNHLCLIFEFRNVEEFVQKNLALTNSQSLFMERMMVQSFLRFICQFAKWIKQSFAPSLHHSLSLKEILLLLKSR